MRIDPSELGAEQAYRLITGIVVPRPIAWVTSLSAGGVVNLAPFSAFTFVSPKPPMLAISVGRKAGIYKDTAHNILNNEEYVVHIADSTLMTAVDESSTEHPPDVSEVEELKLETIPSERIKHQGAAPCGADRHGVPLPAMSRIRRDPQQADRRRGAGLPYSRWLAQQRQDRDGCARSDRTHRRPTLRPAWRDRDLDVGVPDLEVTFLSGRDDRKPSEAVVGEN